LVGAGAAAGAGALVAVGDTGVAVGAAQLSTMLRITSVAARTGRSTRHFAFMDSPLFLSVGNSCSSGKQLYPEPPDWNSTPDVSPFLTPFSRFTSSCRDT
ncbi:MAG: hypothetical protein ABIH46_10135, partial [Chloroflexota bacterium]